MKVSKNDVLHVANLARLSLTESEVEQYQSDLKKILDSVDELKKVPTDSVEVLLNPVREASKFCTERDDEVSESLDQYLVLSNAPDSRYGQFKLEAVMESES